MKSHRPSEESSFPKRYSMLTARSKKQFGRFSNLARLVVATIVVGSLLTGLSFALRRKWLLPGSQHLALPALCSGCINPSKRLEWRQLNNSEQREYLAAVKCLQSRPSVLQEKGSMHDDFPWAHAQMGMAGTSAVQYRSKGFWMLIIFQYITQQPS